MTEATLMTETPATTNEGGASSQPTGQQGTPPAPSGQQQQASEGQTPPAGDGAQGQTEGDTGAPQGAPEKYEFKAPEGREFDGHVIEQFSEVARELNLSQEDAQKVIDKVAPALAAKQERVMAEARTQWVDAAKADREFGGEKLAENLSVAKRALDTFGTPELRTLLEQSGLGNHPEVIRVLYRAGRAISEDRMVTGGQGGKAQPRGFGDYANSLYPTQH